MAERQHVLVTGSAGAIGRVVAAGLRDAGHRVRGFDRLASDGLDDAIVADLTDAEAVRRAVDGVDRVVHLAAYPNPAPFIEVLLEPNVIGLYYVVQSSCEAGVGRLVLASTMQVVGFGRRGRDAVATVDFAAPGNDYALTKLWAEQLGRMAARLHEIEVIAARIGWFCRNEQHGQAMREREWARTLYLSPGDAVRFFRAAVEVEKLDAPDGYATVYAAGPGYNGRVPFDLEPGRRLLGYEPRDTWPVGFPMPVES